MLPCAHQNKRQIHVHAPVAAHAAGNRIPRRHATAVKIHPQLPVQCELITVLLREPAAAFTDFQYSSGHQSKRRQIAPLRGHFCLHGIDDFRALWRGNAQAVITLIAPDLLRGPWCGTFCHGQRLNGFRCPGPNGYFPPTGSNLGVERAVRFKTRRQRTGKCEWQKIVGQRSTELFFTAAAGNIQAYKCFEANRNTVSNSAKNRQLEPILDLDLLTALAQPDIAVFPFRKFNLPAIDIELHQPGVG